MEQLKKTIQSNRFFSLNKDVTYYQTMGGSRVTVYAKDTKKTVGRENSVNERYNAIKHAVFALAEDEYVQWRKKTKEYMYELNE